MRFGDKPLYKYFDADGQIREMSYCTFGNETKAIGTALAAYGLLGKRIAILSESRPEWMVGYVATIGGGGVTIPLDRELQTEQIRNFLNLSEANAIFFSAPYEKALLEMAPELPGVRAFIAFDEPAEPWPAELADRLFVYRRMAEDGREMYENGNDAYTSAHVDVYAMSAIIFTSGTTGMPKLVVHDQTYPLGHIVTAKFWQRVEDGGLHLTVSDSGWAKFGWGCIYGQWISGSAVLGYDMDKFSARHLIDVVRNERPTTFCVPPTMYRFMMKEGITREDFQSVRSCGTAGEALAAETSREFQRITGLVIHEGFGQSEGTVLIGNFPWFDPCPGALGKPSPLYDIAIVDENGAECPVGQEGEIVVRNLHESVPPGLTRGYWVDGKVQRNYDDIYHTGDVAWADENGFYWYVGRNDDVIKCSGYRIGPFEIESVLLTHPAVHEVAITAAPDPIRGQVVCASIVLSEGFAGTPELTKELQTYVKRLTAPYKYPRVVRYVEELPKTVSGKISRARIRAGEDAKNG